MRSATSPSRSDEVVEEVAAHLARRHRDAAHLGERRAQRRAWQQLLLDATADLQLLAQPLLLDQPLLVRAQVAGHAVEGLGQAAELAAVRHRHAHREVAGGQPLRGVGERRDVAGHPPRERQDAEGGDEREPEAEREVAGGGAAEVGKRGTDRPRDPDDDARVRVVAERNDPLRRVAPGGRVAGHDPEGGERLLVVRLGRVDAAVGVDRERDRPLAALGRRQDRSEPEPQLVLLGRDERLAARLLERRLGLAGRRRAPHTLQPLLQLVRHRLDACRHARGERLGLRGHDAPERALRRLIGVDRHAEQRHDREQEEREGELGAKPHGRLTPRSR